MEQRIREYRSNHQLSECGTYRDGCYHSKWYCGLSADMEWLRLSIESEKTLLVRVFVSDAKEDERESGAEPVLERSGNDLLLYGIHGKYLRFTATPATAVRCFTLSFPGRSITDQLPIALQGNDTLRLLLGVYQSLYMDINQDVARFPIRLNPTDTDALPDLGEWLGAARWMRDGLPKAKLLAAAPMLNRLRGTRKGLQLLIQLVTGITCTPVEHFQWDKLVRSMEEREACSRLYGASSSNVTILLPTQVSEKTVRLLLEILDDFIPLGLTYSVTQLKDGTTLDGHCYLDINMELTEPESAGMDEAELGTMILE